MSTSIIIQNKLNAILSKGTEMEGGFSTKQDNLAKVGILGAQEVPELTEEAKQVNNLLIESMALV